MAPEETASPSVIKDVEHSANVETAEVEPVIEESSAKPETDAPQIPEASEPSLEDETTEVTVDAPVLGEPEAQVKSQSEARVQDQGLALPEAMPIEEQSLEKASTWSVLTKLELTTSSVPC